MELLRESTKSSEGDVALITERSMLTTFMGEMLFPLSLLFFFESVQSESKTISFTTKLGALQCGTAFLRNILPPFAAQAEIIESTPYLDRGALRHDAWIHCHKPPWNPSRLGVLWCISRHPPKFAAHSRPTWPDWTKRLSGTDWDVQSLDLPNWPHN